ncbi:MAG TPA: tetratricopeptide repeat protein [Candidatus Omnitrophota bacterium]|nr:tetratricopeptide repeat protein [Candidatus Omnitrophota bacterium]
MRVWTIALLLAATAAAMAPVLFNGFTNWDDQIMITQNAKITSLSPDHLLSFFAAPHERLYHPLVLLNYALEYRFFGFNPFVYHLTNYALHLANTVLVFFLIELLGAGALVSLLVALCFGIHPMHVESVAWLAERKDVLYSAFYLGALIAYLNSKQGGGRKFSFLTMILFVLSLLSKPMALTLPFVLLLLDWYLDKKFDFKRVTEKWSYFILLAVFGAIMVWAHYYSQTIEPVPVFTLLNRALFVCYGIVFYLAKLFVPIRLSNYYPLPADPRGVLPVIYYFAPLVLLAMAAGVAFSLKRTRKAAFGAGFFLIAIFPVLQIMPVGVGVLADRYTYISSIGLFYIIIDAAVSWWSKRPEFRTAGMVTFVLIAGALAVLSFQRAMVWRDGMSLWNDVLKKYPGCALAYYNRGEEYFLRLRDYDRAYSDFSRAIAADPKYSSAYINRALIRYYRGDVGGSIADYDQAIKIDPTIGEAYGNRGNSYVAKGDTVKALADYELALKYKPDYPETYYNRGNLLARLGRYEEAYADYHKALAQKPDYAAAYNNLGNAYFRAGDLDRAFDSFDKAISSEPGYAEAYYNRAVVLTVRGQYRLALEDARRAAALGYRIDPRYIEKLEQNAEAR